MTGLKQSGLISFVKLASEIIPEKIDPAINIDSLFLLTNMMNIKELALDSELID